MYLELTQVLETCVTFVAWTFIQITNEHKTTMLIIEVTGHKHSQGLLGYRIHNSQMVTVVGNTPIMMGDK